MQCFNNSNVIELVSKLFTDANTFTLIYWKPPQIPSENEDMDDYWPHQLIKKQ